MLGLLETGSGFWSAIIWIVVVLVIGSIVIYIRNKGEDSYKKNTEQDKPFISGNQRGFPFKCKPHLLGVYRSVKKLL